MSTQNKSIVPEFMTLGATGDFDAALEHLALIFAAHLSGMPGRSTTAVFGRIRLPGMSPSATNSCSFKNRFLKETTLQPVSSTQPFTRAIFKRSRLPADASQFKACFFDPLLNGKELERRGQFDTMGMLTQLGVIPSP